MANQQSLARRAGAEARTWFRKLSSPVISNEEIWAYAAWCRVPGNQAAYNRVEARARKAPDDALFTEAEILAALKRRPDLAKAHRAAFKRAERPATLADIARELRDPGVATLRTQAELLRVGCASGVSGNAA